MDMAEYLTEVQNLATVVQPIADADKEESIHSHPVEWWYFTGHLSAGDMQLAFEYTIFAFFSPVSGRRYFQAYFSYIDLDNMQYLSWVHESFSAYTEKEDGFRFVFPAQLRDHEEWIAETTDVPGSYNLRAGFRNSSKNVPKRGVNLFLQQSADRSPVLHGDGGVVDFLGTPMGYYTRSNLDVTGGLKYGNQYHQVTGKAWLDHQWGNVQLLNRRWKYLAAQVELNGEKFEFIYYEVFISSSPTQSPEMKVAYRVDADGSTDIADNVQVTTARVWVGLPVENSIAIQAAGGEQLKLIQKPYFDQQHRHPENRPFPARLMFWEGASEILMLDAYGAEVSVGSAFLELGGKWPQQGSTTIDS